jgi:hypothetical protein
MLQRCHLDRLVLVIISSVLLVWSSFPIRALATHEVDHRFTVHGTVRDGRAFPGRPLGGKEVVIRDSKNGEILQRGTTDQRGRFSLILHLHNEDQGRLLIVQSQGAEKTLELQFDPNDRTTERQAQVDLVVLPK